jgi:hypothetical protein
MPCKQVSLSVGAWFWNPEGIHLPGLFWGEKYSVSGFFSWTQRTLTLSLLMSYIYVAPCEARNLTSYIYGPTLECRLFLFAAQCFNTESMQKFILCHSCM